MYYTVLKSDALLRRDHSNTVSRFNFDERGGDEPHENTRKSDSRSNEIEHKS